MGVGLGTGAKGKGKGRRNRHRGGLKSVENSNTCYPFIFPRGYEVGLYSPLLIFKMEVKIVFHHRAIVRIK